MVQARREFILYLAVSVLLLAFDRTYAIFSHGVSSSSMTLMFMPVLLGGLLFVTMRWIMKGRLWNHRLYRLFSFLYHSAMVLLVNGMLVTGILEIAHTNSQFLYIYPVLAGLVTLLSFITLFVILRKKHS